MSTDIKDLDPSIQPKIQCFLDKTNEAGFNLRITSGYRSIAEQDELYTHGRTAPGAIVTNAKGGDSWHNYGLAIDIVDRKLGYGLPWANIEALGTSCGLEQGTVGSSSKDLPHFQYRGGLSIEQVKAGQRPDQPSNKSQEVHVNHEQIIETIRHARQALFGHIDDTGAEADAQTVEAEFAKDNQYELGNLIQRYIDSDEFKSKWSPK